MKTAQYVRQEKAIDTSWYVEQQGRIEEATNRAALLRRQLAERFDRGYLYVIEFDSGVIKVGKTANVESRLKSHAKTGLIRYAWASQAHLHCSKTERLLISYCGEHGQLHGGREYFRNLEHLDVCTYAGMVVKDAIRRAYLDDLIEAADGDLDVTWAEAHARLGDGTEIGEVA